MIKPIMKSEIFLRLPSSPATEADSAVGKDLLDTLQAHESECVGMAANMIGVAKRIIVFNDNGRNRVMYNPVIISNSGPFDTQEGCLSLDGVRSTRRYKRIKVSYQDETFKQSEESFSGWTAQIIQHEIDHCNGIII